MSGLSVIAVFGGAGAGALLRWWFSVWLNPVVPTLPLGTLAANLVGGLLVGIALAYFASDESVPAEWRLLIVTGFLGGLTTFSTFSAEVVTLMQRAQYAWALGTAGAHLVGSLVLTGIGIAIGSAMIRTQ